MLTPYNRPAALAYAKKWAYSRNPVYYDFSSIGGDCTNFISQCLVAGGMPMNFSYPLGWYYTNANNRSPSFTHVQYLYNFLTRNNKNKGPVAQEIDLCSALVGDVIQLSFDGETFAHSLIITEVNGDEILIAAHSDDAFNRNFLNYYFQKMRVLQIIGAY
jgi:hypothetical protein